MLNFDTYLPKLKEFEGVVPYMYLDTAGNVTVGVGNLLASPSAAQKLAFVRRANALAKPPIVAGPAKADEIKTDFDLVSKQRAGKSADYYKQFTKVDLPDSVSESLLKDRLVEFRTSLYSPFPNYNRYCAEACAAIIDMAFNLGLSKLTASFPTFCKAVKAEDWATAADECERGGINTDRNDWTKAQFKKADSLAKAAAKFLTSAKASSKIITVPLAKPTAAHSPLAG